VDAVRILFLNPLAILGGAERVMLDACASLKHAEPSIELGLIAADEGPLLDRARSLGVDVRVVPMPRGLSALGDSGLTHAPARAALNLLLRSGNAALQLGAYTAKLSRAVTAFRPTVVHSNGNKMHLLSAVLGRGGAPLVWHLHDLIGERPMIRRALRGLAFRANAAAAISEAVAQDGQRVLGALPIHVVLNAVDTAHFTPAPGDGAALDALAGLATAPEGTLRVGLVATFARWKGQALFLEALRHYLDAKNAKNAKNATAPAPVRFYIVGGPVYRTLDSQFSEEELRTLAAQRNVGSHVAFVPFQAQPRDVYRALDIVVHASTRPEPFGLTIAESLACGRPTVVSAGGGAVELFTDGHDALGFPPGDAPALAQRLQQLAASPALRETLSRNARQTAVERFSRERMGHQLLALYRTLPGVSTR